MPLYEYQCETCHQRFEKIQKFSDPLEHTCPSCGGTATRLPSSPAIQFKGSGFYINDYAKKSSSDAGKSGGAKDSTDAKTKASTDSKADSGSSTSEDSKPSTSTTKKTE
jgi:putative FmdB family regulatory protein